LAEGELALFEKGLCYYGAGCEKCNNVGMRSRLGFFEVILTTVKMRQAISKRCSSQDVAATVGPGFVTMRRDGIMKAAIGMTTVEEVLRATQDADEGVVEAGA